MSGRSAIAVGAVLFVGLGLVVASGVTHGTASHVLGHVAPPVILVGCAANLFISLRSRSRSR